MITAITPFNHPMNQVAHKVVPSVATNNRMVLKPSEKVPFSAILPFCTKRVCHPRCSVVTGDPREIADELLTNEHVDLITFTGGVAIGKYIANKAGYRRMVLELGGNDPIIVMEDADIDEASTLAVQGSYKNSGQRCVQRSSECWYMTPLPMRSPSRWSPRQGLVPTATRPIQKSNEMGTVIDEPGAAVRESVNGRCRKGARLLVGNERRGALYSPTVLDRVDPAMTVARRKPLVRCRQSSVSAISTKRSNIPQHRHGLWPRAPSAPTAWITSSAFHQRT